MNHNKFEGDLSEFSPQQIEYISRILVEKGFENAKVTIQPVGEAGDNYAASVKRIVAEKNDISFKMIAKVAPRIEQVRVTLNTRAFFLNEHTMYTEVLPKFTELEKGVGIPQDERLRYATCYGTITEDLDELILLEDLKDSHFVMLDRFKSLTDGEVKLILKSFSRLHSLSYALKRQDPDTFNMFQNKLIDTWKLFAENEQFLMYFPMVENDCISVLNDTKHKNGVKNTLSKMLEIGKKIRNFDDQSRFSVIQQGDSWTNNIMFRLQDDIAVSCCMIDYQISKVSSPVADLHYMILNCTDHSTRKRHFYDWIDYYHSELDKSLSEFGLKANYVYPRDQLDADLNRHGKISIATGILLASALSRQTAEASKFKAALEEANEDNMEETVEATRVSAMDEKSLAVFRARVEGIVDTCLEFGFL